MTWSYDLSKVYTKQVTKVADNDCGKMKLTTSVKPIEDGVKCDVLDGDDSTCQVDKVLLNGVEVSVPSWMGCTTKTGKDPAPVDFEFCT